MKKIRTIFRCWLYNRAAFVITIVDLILSIISTNYSPKENHLVAHSLGVTIFTTFLMLFLALLLALFTSAHTFATYENLKKIYLKNPLKANAAARGIANSKKDPYCNKRGAKLFLKDYA